MRSAKGAARTARPGQEMIAPHSVLREFLKSKQQEVAMSNVTVHKIAQPEKAAEPLLAEIEKLLAEIKERAFNIFQWKGSVHGHELENWLEAEREITCCPTSELVEKESEFDLNVAVPGMEVKDIEITALPESIVVKGHTHHQREKNEGTIHFSEFSEKELFRQVALPAAIDVDKVSAHLEKGMLQIVARKKGGVTTVPLAA